MNAEVRISYSAFKFTFQICLSLILTTPFYILTQLDFFGEVSFSNQ